MRLWPRRRQAEAEAHEELERARRQLEDVRRQWPAVHEAVGVMREHRERNGFAEAIRTAMGVRD